MDLLQDEREAGRAQGIVQGITRGKADGRLEGRAEAVLYLLQELSGEIPKSLQEKILSEKDDDVLKRYLRMASRSNSVEEFMELMS